MKTHEMADLSALTAHERHQVVELSLEQRVPLVQSQDVALAVTEIAPVVAERYQDGREIRPGFALLVIDWEDLEAAAFETTNEPFGFRLDVEQKALAIERVDVPSWNQDNEIEDIHFREAAIKALITNNTGVASGDCEDEVLTSLDEHYFRLTPDFRVLNQPGAILVGDLIFSVSGLEAHNNREVAEAVALRSLELAYDRTIRENRQALPPVIETISKADFKKYKGSGYGQTWNRLIQLISEEPDLPIDLVDANDTNGALVGDLEATLAWLEDNQRAAMSAHVIRKALLERDPARFAAFYEFRNLEA
ncbi:MAG: hypothetical protein ABIQ89_02720 [Candidatus Saccharimonadales bacterium]